MNRRTTTLASLGITPELIRAYDRRIPRYTSYPPAPYWSPSVTPEQWEGHLRAASDSPPAPLSLYVHIPFCARRCHFCACNVIITRKDRVVSDYLDQLAAEVDLLRRHYRGQGPVVQLHLGGGTPNYLQPEQMRRLLAILEKAFPFAPGAERSIEMDPRIARPEQIALLSELGFNRVSFGVQDFHAETQAAIGRTQTLECTVANVEAARRHGMRSVNLDLVYGLPRQTVSSWARTLETVLALRPDRLAIYNFAWLPRQVPNQRSIAEDELPPPDQKLEMFIAAHDVLRGAGYEFIGMDHYALAGDALAVARRDGTLRRNFMGYTTLRGTDLLAFGASAISDFHGMFVQNVKKLSQYSALVAERGVLPVERGLLLSEDDRLRRHVIEEIMCNGHLLFTGPYGEQVRALVAENFEALRPLEDDGIVVRDGDGLSVTAKGRLFLRNVAHVFDAWARRPAGSPIYSRAV